MCEVIFTIIAATKTAREGNLTVINFLAGGPRVDLCFDYLNGTALAGDLRIVKDFSKLKMEVESKAN